MKLDGYGECFNRTDVGKKLRKYSPWGKTGLISSYKFYLAFENAIYCNDYISEKFWRNSLGSGAVPVVFGPHPDDVREMAPPNSYIHVEDFATGADLVACLDYLDKNETAYLEYHQWRKMEPKENGYLGIHAQMPCDLCKEVKRRKAAGWAKRMISRFLLVDKCS